MRCDQSLTQDKTPLDYDFPRCIACRCQTCNQTKKTCEEIKKMIKEKLDVKLVEKVPDTEVNLCGQVEDEKEMGINYTYTDMGRQMMILDLRAPVSIAGVPWLEQCLEEFNLKIQDLKTVKCHQPFVFGPSCRDVSESLVELPVLVT